MAVGLVAASLTPACGEHADPVSAAPATSEASQELQAAIERVIPIDAVYLRMDGETVPPPDTRLQVQRTVALMNRPFQRAGVQFYLRSYKHVSAPTLATIQFEIENPVPWAPAAGNQVRQDVINIWGSDPWPTRLATNEHIPSNWLGLSVHAKGAPDAQYLFVSSGSRGSNAPHNHRYVYMNRNNINDGNGLSAHEMGHSFRLSHPWDVGKVDPRTGALTVPSNFWDLAYCPGSSTSDPHRFFADQAEANVGCAVGQPKMIFGDDGQTQWCGFNGTTSEAYCWLPGRLGTAYWEYHAHDSPGLRRGATFRDSNGAPGVNFMSYLPSPGSNGFSPSQIEMMRNTLRFDYRVNLGDVVGGVANNPLVGKPKLGTATASRPPLYQVDVNGDGARDLVYWTMDPFAAHAANSGSFTVAYAPDFTVRQTSSFGRPGDIPVIADFDGDGRSDHGVYRPDEAESGSPSSQGIWYFCLSTAAGLGNCAGGGYQSRAFGEARDIPLPGLKLGGVPHLAVYRADNTTVYWGPASNPFPFSFVAIDPLNPNLPHELLLDDWDGDGKTDLGVFLASTGIARLTLSTNNWSSAGIKTFVFPSTYSYAVPDPDPYSYQPDARSGAFPLQGLRRAVSAGPPSGTQSALALWNPGTGETCISTNVASLPLGSTNAATCASTQWIPPGVGGLPLGGLRHPRWTDGIAMTAWITQPNAGTTPVLHRNEVSTGGTTGPGPRSLTGARTRGTATFVADMGTVAAGNRDGLPELLIEGNEAGQWLIFWSQTDYTTSTAFSAGGHNSHMLLSSLLRTPRPREHLMTPTKTVLTSVLLLSLVAPACSRDEPLRRDPAQVGVAAGQAGSPAGGSGPGVGAGQGGSAGSVPAAGAGQGGAGGGADADACPTGLPGPSLVRLATPAGTAYCMDRTEITQSQYATFITAAEADPGLTKNVKGQHPICASGFPLILANPGPPDDVYNRCRASLYQPKELPDNPVVCVDHCAARAYCQWAGKELCGAPGGGATDLSKTTDPSASAWDNACTSGGKNETAVKGGIASGVCTVVDGHGRRQVAVDAEPACHSDVPPFDALLGIGGGVLEWEDACDNSGCSIRGAIEQQDPSAPDKRLVLEACHGQAFSSTHAAEYIGFRCCKPLAQR